MRLGQSLVGNPVIRITDGRELGKVKDLYLDNNLKFVVGVFLGSEGLIKRTPTFVRSTDVAVFGMDAVLARDTVIIQEGDRTPGAGQWVRLDDLQGRDVDTPGGTKIGRVRRSGRGGAGCRVQADAPIGRGAPGREQGGGPGSRGRCWAQGRCYDG